MARIRSAKPEFWTDPLMTALSRDVRFTFKGLFEVCADDFGRFLGDPRLVKSQIWPLDDDLTVKKVDAMLRKLHELDRIHLYEVNGVRYGQVVNWSKHQRVDHPKESRIPPEVLANDSRGPRENGASVSRPRARGGDRKGGEGRGEERNRSKAEAVSGVIAEASDEPGSAAAVATLPNSELPGVTATSYGIAGLDATGGVAAIQDAAIDANGQRLGPPETPAQSPNGADRRQQGGDPASRGTADAAEPLAGAIEARQVSPDPQPLDIVLPHAAVRFGKTFYPRGVATDARRLDVFEQLLQVLKPEGLPFNGGITRATPARLSAACLAVLRTHTQTPLEDTDAAIAYLLVKLSDVSQDSPTERAAVEAKVDEQSDRMTLEERKAIADKIAAEHPEVAAAIDADAVKVFPGKAKEMAQPRESYRISRLLKLKEEVTT